MRCAVDQSQGGSTQSLQGSVQFHGSVHKYESKNIAWYKMKRANEMALAQQTQENGWKMYET